MKLVFNFLTIETFSRIDAAHAFLSATEQGSQMAAVQQRKDLKLLAEKEGWEFEEYASEQDMLELTLTAWIPTLAAYSACVLLHSIVETQLQGFADHLGSKSPSGLCCRDRPGKGIERSAKYLKLAQAINVKADRDWSKLQDLQELRNIVVHRGGKPGDPTDPKNPVDTLLKRYPKERYPKGLELHTPDGIHAQLSISMELCRVFLHAIDGFFVRIFQEAGLPNRRLEPDASHPPAAAPSCSQ